MQIKNRIVIALSTAFLWNTEVLAGFDEYLDDIKAHSVIRTFPRGVRQNLKASYDARSVPLYGRAVALMHGEFDREKERLISDWERVYGIKWPRYKQPVYRESTDSAGKPIRKQIRKSGDRYDAHHIIPQSHNGPNVYWNLVPLTVGNHIRLHNPNSTLGEDSCSLFQRSCGLRTQKRV